MCKTGKIFNGFVPFAFFCKMMVKFNLSLHFMAQWSRASKEIYIHLYHINIPSSLQMCWSLCPLRRS